MESTKDVERPMLREPIDEISTTAHERANERESTKYIERATARESTSTTKRAKHMESTI